MGKVTQVNSMALLLWLSQQQPGGIHDRLRTLVVVLALLIVIPSARAQLPSIYKSAPYDTLPVYNVKVESDAYGDQLHDDTRAIQAMLDLAGRQPLQSANNRRAIVYLPSGIYYVTPQEDMWETAYDNRGTPSNLLDDQPTHKKCLTVPGGVVVTGPAEINRRPTITLCQCKSAGKPSISPQANPVGVHVFASGVWDIEATHPYDYRADWKAWGQGIEFRNLRVLGFPIAQVYINGNAEGKPVENSAFQLMHGYDISLHGVMVEDFHRGVLALRSTRLNFEDCQTRNCWYIGLAFYAPNWHGRAEIVTNEEEIVVKNCRSDNTDAFVASFLSREQELSFNPAIMNMFFIGVYSSGWTTIEGCNFNRSSVYVEFTPYVNIQNNAFANSKLGIRYGYLKRNPSSSQTKWPYPAGKICSNTFSNVTTGIVVGNATGLDLTDNHMNSLNTGSGGHSYRGYCGDLVYGGHYGFTGFGKAGIWMENVKDVRIVRNEIVALRGGYHSAGIVVKNDPHRNSRQDVRSAARQNASVVGEDNTITYLAHRRVCCKSTPW